MVPPIWETPLTSQNVKKLTDAELAIANKEYESRIAANLLSEKEKLPELESENYKIDKEMSVEEKLNNWWKEEKGTSIDSIFKSTKINVLKKDLGNWAYIWEYLDGPAKWEQIFNWEAVLKLWLDRKLPRQEDINKIWHKKLLQMFNNLPGWSLGYESFHKIGKWADIRLLDGSNVVINENKIFSDSKKYPERGYSVRLIKY